MEGSTEHPAYIILLTGQSKKEEIVAGLRSGANDYITKPFNEAELQARLDVGCNVLDLQTKLEARIRDLEDSLREIKVLQGILPICSYCKKVRNDDNYWEQVEEYITTRSNAIFSHSVCPSCFQNIVIPELRAMNIPVGKYEAELPGKGPEDSGDPK